MKIKNILIGLLLAMSISIKASEIKPIETWFEEFNISMLTNQNPILQAHGIYALSHNKAYTNQKLLNNSLEILINYSDLDERIYTIIAGICELERNKNICIQMNFANKYIKTNPQNFLNYLPLINLNAGNNNSLFNETMIKVLEKTKTAVRKETIGFIELKNALQDYHFTSPMPTLSKADILNITNSYKSSMSNESFDIFTNMIIDNQIENTINNYIYTKGYIKNTNISGILNFCENPDSLNACIVISNLLANSKDLHRNPSLRKLKFELRLKINLVTNNLEDYYTKLLELLIFENKYIQNCYKKIGYEFQNSTEEKSYSAYTSFDPIYLNHVLMNIENPGFQLV